MIDAFILLRPRNAGGRARAAALTARLAARGHVSVGLDAATLISRLGTRILTHERAGAAVVGTLFRRDDNTLVESLERGLGYRVAATGGTALTTDFWGGYVAVIVEANGSLRIVRDPSGACAVYWLRHDDIDIAFSELAMLIEAGIEIPPFNFSGLAHHLRYPGLRSSITGLADVREVLPGQRLDLAGSQTSVSQLWSPWSFACAPVPAIDDAAQRVESVVSSTALALTSRFERVQLELSGGLDSSILAACLAHRPHPWRCVTFATRAADGEERGYARAVAQLAQVELAEFFLEVSDVEPFQLSDMARVRPGGFAILGYSDRLLQDQAATYCADAICSGAGGDNVFCTINSAMPVLDAWREAGLRATWTALGDVARLNEATLWDAARHMLREAMVRRAVRAVEKIRAQGLLATRLIAFAHGSKFKPNAPSASRSARLSPATDDPRIVAQVAEQMADAMFVRGSVYTKCGVMLEGLHAQSAAQPDLFAAVDPRAGELLLALDGLNQRYGRGTMRLATEGQGDRAYDTKRSQKSPAWTTRLAEIPIAR